MGALLVGKVLARWTSAPDNAFRVLVQMAMTALDAPSRDMPAGLYFGGHEPLKAMLRSDGKATADSRERTVRRALADLADMGAIERTNKARSGMRQVYRLTLDNEVRPLERKPNRRFAIDEPPVDNFIGSDPQPDTSCPPQADTTSPAQADTMCPERRTPVVRPRNQEEPLEEKRKETPGFHEPVTLARASPAADRDGFIAPPQCGYPECSRGWIIPSDPSKLPHQCPRCNSNVIPFPDRRTA